MKRIVSVIIPCHNYGELLGRCLQSVLGQTQLPEEIIVVDDASDDNTREVAEMFKTRGVRYMRVDYRSALLARSAGFKASCGDIVCCIDADDYVSPRYIEEGLHHFDADPVVGIVYSDVEFIGNKTGRSEYPASSDEGDIISNNFIHAGALVRRDAVEIADAFSNGGPAARHEDWSTWRKILELGFRAVKQSALYYYYKHSRGLSRDRSYNMGDYTYYIGAALSEETITIVTPLAGRWEYWEKYKRFLEQQLWNHRQINLLFLDTSHDSRFSADVRAWLAQCDYPSTRYISLKVGGSGLADEKRIDEAGHARQDVLKDVRVAMARIYGRIRRAVDTNYAWIIEDDVIPPLDACERLLQAFCPDTVSVSGAVAHRYEKSYVAWGKDGQLLQGGEGVEVVDGNGFGCLMVRTSALETNIFSCCDPYPDFDRAFYANLPKGKIAKLNWDVMCDHLSPHFDRPSLEDRIAARKNNRIPRDEFDEEYYLHHNNDVARAIQLKHFESGYDHFVKHGQSEGRPARTRPVPTSSKPAGLALNTEKQVINPAWNWTTVFNTKFRAEANDPHRPDSGSSSSELASSQKRNN